MSFEAAARHGARLRARRDPPRRAAYDETEEYPRELVERAAALGLTCYDLPAEYGGGGVGEPGRPAARDRGADLGRQPDRALHLPGRLLRRADARARQRTSSASAGCRRCAARPRRPPRWPRPSPRPDPTPPRSRPPPRRVDGGYVLDGHKKFIGNAPIADACVVFATVAPGTRSKGITAFVVERGDPGFVHRRPTAEDGQPLLPGRRAALRGVLRRRRPSAGGGGPGLLRA